MSNKVEKALRWIVSLLKLEKIQYQIVGGFAAHLHGGSRAVADIDLYITQEDADKLLPHVLPFVSKPLQHYREEGWDLEYFQLIYHSQKIEIGLSPATKIYSSESNQWIDLPINYQSSVHKSYCGIEVFVMPIQDLVAYKSILARDVDWIDINELTSLTD